MTREEARRLCLSGWNIRCNRCGSYGAEWVRDMRPGWGSLALCPRHADELRDELDRHSTAMQALAQINFEQDRLRDL